MAKFLQQIIVHGGILGSIIGETTIQSCINYGRVCACVQQSGGIIGSCWNYTITICDCINYGEIIVRRDEENSHSGDAAGGISGLLGSDTGEGSAEVQRCKNYGKVIAEYQLAGEMVGKLNCGTIIDCINYGEITTKAIDVGGIIGWNKKCENITGCINYGKITAKLYGAGGVVGRMRVGKINYCSNYGEIYSLANEYNGNVYASRAGGIVGICSKANDIEINKVVNFGKIECINTPNISGDSNGGIIGQLSSGKVDMLTNAYNKGEVIGGDNVGEIVGYNTISEAVSNCFYYKRENSVLQGIGGSSETGDTYFSGTEGNIEFDYESLDDFLSKKGLN